MVDLFWWWGGCDKFQRISFQGNQIQNSSTTSPTTVSMATDRCSPPLLLHSTPHASLAPRLKWRGICSRFLPLRLLKINQGGNKKKKKKSQAMYRPWYRRSQDKNAPKGTGVYAEDIHNMCTQCFESTYVHSVSSQMLLNNEHLILWDAAAQRLHHQH